MCYEGEDLYAVIDRAWMVSEESCRHACVSFPLGLVEVTTMTVMCSLSTPEGW